MWQLLPTCATADQGVGVNHGPVADVGAGVDVRFRLRPRGSASTYSSTLGSQGLPLLRARA